MSSTMRTPPSVDVRCPPDERRFVEDMQGVIIGHQLAQAVDVASIDAIDETEDRRGADLTLCSPFQVPDLASFAPKGTWEVTFS
jgi:hypothetical protein